MINKQSSSAVKVEVYSTAMCPYCQRAKHLLDRKGVSYVEYRVDLDDSLRIEMEQRSKRFTVPQIFINDQHIGGFDDMAELDMDEELDPLLGLSKV
jgi:glutaredoxin 3